MTTEATPEPQKHTGEQAPAAPEHRNGQFAPEAPRAPEERQLPRPMQTGGSPPKAPAPQKATLSPQLDAEIDAAMAELGFGSSASAERKPAIRRPRVVEAGREHRHGTVVSVGPTDVFLEFGPKELGVAPRTQWKEEELPAVGDSVEIVIDRFDADESLFICSKPGSVVKAEWEMLELGQIVEARVVGTNKGGLELEVAQHRAFMPASQVSLERIEDLSVFVGEKFTCQVSQLDRRGKGNIVLSRRDLLAQERKEQAERLKASLSEGQTLEGTVRKIMPFGAFIDLGGIDGLVHISDLSHERVNFGEKNVQRFLKEGDRVNVQILKLDWDAGRISLGMKQLQEDPFSAAISDIKDGAELTGKVTRLADFGAFVEVATGVEGLVHVSEIAHRRINKPADVLSEGQVLKVKVLKVDPGDRRISLSIKALEKSPHEKKAEEIRQQESPALRRLREKFGKQGFKGGLG
jgi:small subunit ribosomal protein S1